VKEIELTRGYVALVDDQDYERVIRFNWYAHVDKQHVYAARSLPWAGGKRRPEYLHRFILGAPSDIHVDHRNRNTLDCRRDNLREATQAQNMQNRGKFRTNRTGYKGVDFFTQCGKWRAQIKVHGKTMHLGLFSTPEDAARAYDATARREYGEFAWTNFGSGRSQ